MSARAEAVRIAYSRHPKQTLKATPAPTAIYGKNTFNVNEMKARLPRDVFKRLKANMDAGVPIDFQTAAVVAHALKEWALDRGVSHFCHWFQPMTGVTAEKHESFITYEQDGVFGRDQMIERFSARELVQGEPDASSFPSGGLRATFEARGYTAWDPTTPPFIIENVNGKTLCIPSAFVSYTGEALDLKTPLLRSMQAINDAAVRLLHLLGDTKVQRVVPTLGPEQEYFFIDRAFVSLRPDLVAAGRTVFGAPPAKGQELEDQYFGTIRERALAAIAEAEYELLSLGIPAKTRHNEVAPAQLEIAPIYEPSNRAADHNNIVMETLRRVAQRHDLVCLIHEKPFAGINGSGKHNNWSVATDTGDNLLDPGETPHDNLRFLCFLTACIRAVHKHGGLLRAAIAYAANDHRLGANEAPPAIMSVFLGEALTRVVRNIEEGAKGGYSTGRTMDLGAAQLPKLSLDNTDRNRTSPFAFTGNKFEFRAVGSSANIAWPNTVLNTAVAEALDEIRRRIEGERNASATIEEATLKALRVTIAESKAVLFDGNNYAAEWHAEAVKRGLANDRDTVSALRWYEAPSTIQLFEQYKVLSHAEIKSRHEVAYERYTKQIAIEGKVGVEMVRTGAIPAALRWLAQLGPLADEFGAEVRDLVLQAKKGVETLEGALTKLGTIDGAHHQAEFARDEVLAALQALRKPVDRLEQIVPDDLWPFPKYSEMLFLL